MEDEHGIAIQVSYGSYSFTTQVNGTPWSPDVFNDIAKQAVRGLREMVSDFGTETPLNTDDGETVEEFLTSLMNMTDESGD